MKDDDSESVASATRHFDLIIIGGGSAAFAAAIEADRNGLSTLMINTGLPLGGTCVNVGCIPSKFLVNAAQVAYHKQQPLYWGFPPLKVTLDYKALHQQLTTTIENLRERNYHQVLRQWHHVQLVNGHARFIDAHTISVDGKGQYSADFIIIATGSVPQIPSIAGIDQVEILTNETIFNLEQRPDQLLIIGAGPMGIELGQAFHRLGSRVIILEQANRILPTLDSDISRQLDATLRREGIEIFTAAHLEHITQQHSTIVLHGTHRGQQWRWEASHILLATGRRGRTAQLNLAAAGIQPTEQGFIPVQPTLQTSVPHIYAVGDCNTQSRFVYTAAREGQIAVRNLLSPVHPIRIDYTFLPWTFFTDPPISGIGYTEHQLQRAAKRYDKSVLLLSELPRAILSQQTEGFIKLLRDPQTDELLGASIVAPNAGELITVLAFIFQNRLTTRKIIDGWYPYLTFAEGIKLAALGFHRELQQLSCCAT